MHGFAGLFGLSLRLVERREPIPGVTLPVGRPILESQEYPTTMILIAGKDYGFLIYPGEGEGVLLFRIRAERAAGDSRSSDDFRDSISNPKRGDR